MKIQNVIITIILLTTTYFLFNSCAIEIDVVGEWDIMFDWGCDGNPQPGGFTIEEDGTFSDPEGGTGTWILEDNEITLTYNESTCVYVGTVNNAGNQVEGTMSTSTQTGCWEGEKEE